MQPVQRLAVPTLDVGEPSFQCQDPTLKSL
jgi:hypothetical protein